MSTVLISLVAVIGYSYPWTHPPSYFPSFPSHLPHCVLVGRPQVHLFSIYIFNVSHQSLFEMLLL